MGVSKNEMEMYQESTTYNCVALISRSHYPTSANMALMSMQKAPYCKTDLNSVDRSVWIQKVKAHSNGWLERMARTPVLNQPATSKSLHHVTIEYLV